MLLTFNRQRPNSLAHWHTDLNDVFDHFFKPFDTFLDTGSKWPTIDVTDHDSHIVVRAEIPGCDAADIDVNVKGDVLTISGEKKQSFDKKEKNLYHLESAYGSFRRDIYLPADIDPDKIEAVYDKGVLSLTFPKSDKAKPVKIKING